jgi:PadR family transcriptional regulator PadR
MQPNLILGTLDLLVLQSLSAGELHGLGVARRIELITGGAFRVKPGSLFPALYRMQQAGWLASEFGKSETNRDARFYRLTSKGRRQLQRETEQWARVARAMSLALKAT